ncbi:MAG TPA: RelA/SpoT family protein [Patescibacteria group bacterium]|nr:RelA/SpoT family protein [Patescibacteria group bacterium]
MTHRPEIPEKISINHIIEKVKRYARPTEIDLVYLAYEVADRAHQGQLRKSGEPYIMHPLATAYILASMRIDPAIIAAALLHDVPEDTQVTLEEIEKDFGKDIAAMIQGITKLGKLKYRGAERYIENLRKMFVAMAEDVRVMIIKFADRIHNLLTLDALEEKKRYRIALESLEIYAPIANRLGMGEFKALLEMLSFPYVFPKEYQRAKVIQDKVLSDEEQFIERILLTVRKELSDAGIKYLDVHGRKKQIFSFYQKLLQKDWEADKIYDLVALRIIVPDVGDCYATLGFIHKLWKPLKGRVKDYIAQPKPNGYQSLHTTVFCDGGRIVEFQIRTQEMHYEAEFGVAAHWHYDERGVKIPAKDIRWAKELAELQKDALTDLSDLEQLKVDFFQNRIFVFTPKGDVIDLPEDATPVDFAYHIHSEIGNKCSGVRINDQIADLSTPLKSGDVVEVIVDKNRKIPNADWLKSVKTHLARSHIKNNLKSRSLDSWLKYILPQKKK